MDDKTISNRTDRSCLYVLLAVLGVVLLAVGLSWWGLKGMGL